MPRKFRVPRQHAEDMVLRWRRVHKGFDFTTALGYGKDSRMKEALDHLESKRLPDGRWNLDWTNGNMVVESRGKPSKMITFLALRVRRRAGLD